MRVGGLRAPTQTDAPTVFGAGFCESGNSIRYRRVLPSRATRCSLTRSGRRGLALRHTRRSNTGTADPADTHTRHNTNTSASCGRHPPYPWESLATSPCTTRMSRTLRRSASDCSTDDWTESVSSSVTGSAALRRPNASSWSVTQHHPQEKTLSSRIIAL